MSRARERLANILKRDARVLRAGSAEAALGMLGRDGVDLVLSDAALPGVSGFDFLRIVRENYPLAEFVMLADAPDVDLAVQAVKLGAYHVLVKDAEPETVLLDRRARLRAAGPQPPGAGAGGAGAAGTGRPRFRLRPEPGHARGAREGAQGGDACRPPC